MNEYRTLFRKYICGHYVLCTVSPDDKVLNWRECSACGAKQEPTQKPDAEPISISDLANLIPKKDV